MNWSERDLDLFKSRRQRGTAPPTSREFELHCLIADVLKRWCDPAWRYTHMPMGEYRTPATAKRLKRMGVTPGWPDFVFFHVAGKVCFLELKRHGEKPTGLQADMAIFLQTAKHDYFCTDGFNDALNALKNWGVVPSKITSWGVSNTQRDAAPCDRENAIDKDG